MEKITAKAGKLEIGGESPVSVQTMCNTHTADIEASLSQCRRLAVAGAQMIRLTTPSLSDVDALSTIKRSLRAEGIDTPLVADIHFRSDVAFAAARVAEKVRINPGNFHKDHDKAREEFRRFLALCRECGTAVRIGVNHGSLGEDITSRYGDSSEGMACAADEWLQMCLEENFHNVVISLKSSNTVVMVDAYRRLNRKMSERGILFPLHLGVTEAGNGDSARLKSAAAISALLGEGIGDTIRISLTEDPEAEMVFGKEVSARFNRCEGSVISPSTMTSLSVLGRTASAAYVSPSWDKLLCDIGCDFGKQLMDNNLDDVNFTGTYTSEEGGEIEIDPSRSNYLKDELLQACRRRFYRPEYVACPGCGRTMYNLEEVFNEVKKRTAGIRGVCIAVMGCIVNGPGEMADADYGYVGEGRGLVSIYRKREAVYRHVPEKEAIDKLIDLIKADGKA